MNAAQRNAGVEKMTRAICCPVICDANRADHLMGYQICQAHTFRKEATAALAAWEAHAEDCDRLKAK